MAKTIATAIGYDNTRQKETHRLGSRGAKAEASTWKTFATAAVNADGSGWIEVKRNDVVLHRYDFGPENSDD